MSNLSRKESSASSLEGAQFAREQKGPKNYDELLQYALSVDLERIHPARLFAVRAALHEVMQVAPSDEVMVLQRAFFRTIARAKEVLPLYQQSVHNNDYSKSELLEALNFAPLTSRSIEKFYSYIISPELFNSSASVQENDPEIPAHCFDFISFCPKSVIQTIAARGPEAILSFHDLGCGPGSIMFIVATLTDAHVSGTELSSAMCRKGMAFANIISRGDIEFINRDLEDPKYSFNGYQHYYCFSPFVWKLEGTYVFARKVASSVVAASGELWLGNYLHMREVFEEEGALKKIEEYGRLAIYKS